MRICKRSYDILVNQVNLPTPCAETAVALFAGAEGAGGPHFAQGRWVTIQGSGQCAAAARASADEVLGLAHKKIETTRTGPTAEWAMMM